MDVVSSVVAINSEEKVMLDFKYMAMCNHKKICLPLDRLGHGIVHIFRHVTQRFLRKILNISSFYLFCLLFIYSRIITLLA